MNDIEYPRQFCETKLKRFDSEKDYYRISKSDHGKKEFYYIRRDFTAEKYANSFPLIVKNLTYLVPTTNPLSKGRILNFQHKVIIRKEPIDLYEGFFSLLESTDEININIALEILKLKLNIKNEE